VRVLKAVYGVWCAQGELDHKQVLMDRGLEFYREVIIVYNTLQGFIVL
jgi:hypothetical protein